MTLQKHTKMVEAYKTQAEAVSQGSSVGKMFGRLRE
jgi:hypothetical protein